MVYAVCRVEEAIVTVNALFLRQTWLLMVKWRGKQAGAGCIRGAVRDFDRAVNVKKTELKRKR